MRGAQSESSMMTGCASKLVNVLKANASHVCYTRQQLFFHDPSSASAALPFQNAAQGVAIRKFASLVARVVRHPAGDQVLCLFPKGQLIRGNQVTAAQNFGVCKNGTPASQLAGSKCAQFVSQIVDEICNSVCYASFSSC